MPWARGCVEQGVRERTRFLLMTVAASAWMATLIRPTLANGDAAVYLSQILERDFSLRTLHIGYLISALPAVAVLPFDPAVRLNLVSLGWGLVGWAALWRLERALLPHRASGWAGVWWLAGPATLAGVTTAEVYTAQTALLLWAVAVWCGPPGGPDPLAGRGQRRLGTVDAGRLRTVGAGLLWAGAISVSPTSVAAFPLFLVVGRSRRTWVALVLSALIPSAILVGLLHADYLWGPRGLLVGPPGLSMLEALRLRIVGLPAAFGWGWLVLVPGLAAALRGEWPAGRRLLGAIALYALCVWLSVDRYRDVPAYAPALALTSLYLAEGTWRWWVQGSRPPGMAVVGLALALQLFAADQQVRKARRDEAAQARLSARVFASIGRDGRVIGDFTTCRLYEWYAVGKAPAGLTLELEPGALEGPGERRFLSLPEAEWLPAGGALRLEPDGGWSWRREPPSDPASIHTPTNLRR